MALMGRKAGESHRYTHFRNYLIRNYEIKFMVFLDNGNRQWFDVAPNSAVTLFLVQKKKNPDNTKVEWYYNKQYQYVVDLTAYDFWPLYSTPLSPSIFKSVMDKKAKDLVCTTPDRLKKGENYVSGEIKAHYNFKNITPTRGWVEGDDWAKTNPGVKDPFVIKFPDKKSRELHFKWYRTDHFAYVFSMLKSQGKNQPAALKPTGLHNFINDDFDSYFNVTQSQREEIAEWISKK